MAGSSESLHEPTEVLSSRTRELHRAIASLREELEAVDWYQQRIDATADEELAAILSHNRDEEKEHAAMLLDWLRRNDDGFEKQLEKRLCRPPDTPVVDESEGSDHDEDPTGHATQRGEQLTPPDVYGKGTR